jgi:hypothetical protein
MPRMRSGHARLGALLSALVLSFAPSVAWACPVCFAAKDEANRLAFLGTTVLLTSLPVLMVGSLIYWIARRSRELELERRRQRPKPSRPTVAAGAELERVAAQPEG